MRSLPAQHHKQFGNGKEGVKVTLLVFMGYTTSGVLMNGYERVMKPALFSHLSLRVSV